MLFYFQNISELILHTNKAYTVLYASTLLLNIKEKKTS